MYGRSTGLSPLAVVVAIFWSWSWGPIGLILSMPLTLCLVVLGRHVERLEFLEVLQAVESTAKDEERPFLADQLDGLGDGAAERSFPERVDVRRTMAQ